jgi:hypothetical protein
VKRIRNLIIVALASVFVLDGSPSYAAVDGACAPELVPLVLTAAPDSTGYIVPTCSKCRRLKLERQTSSTGATYGMLELTYFDEVYGTFTGKIELTVRLADDTVHLVTIEDVLLTNGDEAEWVIDAPSQWTWCAVEMVGLVFVPAA